MKKIQRKRERPVTEENSESEDGDADKWDPFKGDFLGATLFHGRGKREMRRRELGGAGDAEKWDPNMRNNFQFLLSFVILYLKSFYKEE